MLLTALALAAALLPRIEAGLPMLVPPAMPQVSRGAELENPRFDPATRSVSNWHAEAGANLFPRALALTASLSDDPPYVARCVRLNNGWCIKSARWSGEIGADGEGHTAFATMADGADAAASLLRRYFSGYGRRNALAIVRRWAPAECRVGGAPMRTATGRSRTASPVATPAVSAALAPRGLGRTLRARYLAGRRPGGGARGGAGSVKVGGSKVGGLRVQPWSPLARMAGRPGVRPRAGAASSRIPRVAAPRPVADIASGIGPSPVSPATASPSGAGTSRGADDPAALLSLKKMPSPERMVAESALLPAIAAGLPLLDLRLPAPLCTGDEARIQAYAARISGSVGLRPGDDLDLFGPDGTPRPNLGPVMLAMSAVELGTLRAGPELVAAAIARLAPVPPPAGQALR